MPGSACKGILMDTTIRLEDGARKIFLCASGEMNDCSEKMREFLEFQKGVPQ